MKNILKLFMVSLVLSSCGDFEPVVYDGETLAFFNNSTSTLEVLVNGTGSVDLLVGASSLSDVPRTATVSVDLSSSTADAQDYNVPATVTIPANEYFGTLTVTGVDNTLETTPETIRLRIDSVDGGVGSPGVHTISIYQICPVEAPFTGTYSLTTLANGIFNTPTFSTASNVTLAVGTAGALSRSFSVAPYPAFGNFPARTFTFNLTCNEVVVPSGQITNVGCAGSSTTIGPSASVGTYDPFDDTEFEMHFADDEGGASCGAQADGIVRFTKL